MQVTMKGFCLFFLLVLESILALSPVDQEWKDFKTKYNKKYYPEEDPKRHRIFNENKLMIEKHNKKFEKGEVTFKMEINKFADMIVEETNYLRGYKPKDVKQRESWPHKVKPNSTLPKTVDWREKGYVTPVKDQGHCGSCWAFSATGSLEGQNFKATGTLISLSEQNLLDCITFFDCDGGFTNDAFEYVQENKGIDTEESYPYLGNKTWVCKYDPKYSGGNCTGYYAADEGTENELLYATAIIGPISVAIDASSPYFRFYSSGVYYNPNCTSHTDHAVLVVGYGTYEDQDYWLVKNSWGTDWGDEGYIMMARNKNNMCAIAKYFSYPYV